MERDTIFMDWELNIINISIFPKLNQLFLQNPNQNIGKCFFLVVCFLIDIAMLILKFV